MNLTLLALTSSFILHGPAFTGNNMDVVRSKFSKFMTYSLFFNQKTLFVQDSLFQKGLGNILYVEDDITEEGIWGTVERETYEQTTYTTDNYANVKLVPTVNNRNSSFTVKDCLFSNIVASAYNDPIAILYSDSQTSTIYLTDISLTQCTGRQSTIYFDQCRCITMTHICSDRSKGTQSSFYWGKAKTDDFFVFLYSTIIGDKSETSQYYYYMETGDQRQRCINITNARANDKFFQVVTPECLSFGWITLNSITVGNGNVFEVTLANDNDVKHLASDTINFVGCSSNELITLSRGGDGSSFTMSNCYIINPSISNFVYIEKDANSLILADSFSTTDTLNLKDSRGTFTRTNVNINSAHVATMFAYYVDDLYCPGVRPEDTDAYGCAVDNCPPDQACGNRTIGFPDGVLPYPTIIHTDIQTPTPPPSDFFTPSSVFSQSTDFTFSQYFSQSSGFTYSDYFEATDEFSQSKVFSYSEVFTYSEVFSQTDGFSETAGFSQSADFSQSSGFSSSGHFSSSIAFSNSEVFSNSDDFSQSSRFSSSEDFSRSELFSQSVGFSHSEYFTNSDYFSFSLIFSPSGGFSSSSDFTISQEFSQSGVFTNSNTPKIYSDTEIFPQTDDFSQSDDFSRSGDFSQSDDFTQSEGFTKSVDFSQSNEFSQSAGFSSSNVFSKSYDFSQSVAFSESNDFTQSKVFSSSEVFSFSNHFSQSLEFSVSSVFSNSGEFTKTDHFSLSQEFSEVLGTDIFTLSGLFSASKTFTDNIYIDSGGTNNNQTNWVAIGAGAGAGVIVLIAAIALLIYLKNRKPKSSDSFQEAETMSVANDIETTVTVMNPLEKLVDKSDPFADDFEEGAHNNLDFVL